MAILTYKCNLAKEKRSKWLTYLIATLHNAERRTYDGNMTDFTNLQCGLNKFIKEMQQAGILARSKVTTEIREDSGETVLFIKRNGTPLLSIYIK
jgi:hypothetical protein|nr:MAG TPA: hypothetical protein [Caudoviricetes sp.]